MPPTVDLLRVLKAFLKVRRPISVLLHITLVAIANLSAFWLRFDGEVPQYELALALHSLPLLVALRLVFFVPFRLFEGLWKYTSLWDLRNIVIGVTLSTATFLTFMVGLGDRRYPRSIFLIDAILLICMMVAVRLAKRIYIDARKRGGGRRVIVYGAGDAGELIVRDMRQNATFNATPIGFIDDDRDKIGRRIHGVPVLGSRDHLPDIFKTYQPQELLIAIPSSSRKTLREIVRAAEPFKVRITTLPRLNDLMGARVEVGQIRGLKLDDLLARDPIGLPYEPVRRLLEGRCVVVTGSGGSIGTELCRQIAMANPAKLGLLERHENSLFHIHNELGNKHPHLPLCPLVADITDPVRVEHLFRELKPFVVFHAAAHKHVPLMEHNQCEAVRNNVTGTRVLADAARRHGVNRFVLISTDKAVNPTSIMGATKRVAELIVSRMNEFQTTRFTAVRFGNVLGSNGSVVPTFLSQIASGGPLTVTHPEMRRYFMLIPEAVQLVLSAAASDDQAPLFVLDMGEQVRLVDIARDLIRLAGLIPDEDIAIVFSGVRPGEKLSEELTEEGERAEPSAIDKVLRVQQPTMQHRVEFGEALCALENAASRGQEQEVVHALMNLLVNFKPTSRHESRV